MILKLLSLVLVVYVEGSVFDEQLYQDVLDPVECQRQLQFLTNDTLGLQFVDASGKIPPGIMSYNIMDLGDYFQCLSIQKMIDDLDISGKYCTISVPFQQNFPQLSFSKNLHDEKVEDLNRYKWMRRQVFDIVGVNDNDALSHYNADESTGDSNQRVLIGGNPVIGLTLGVCVPRVCTATEAVDFFLDRLVILNLTYFENFCRLPNDKPFVTVDYIAIGLFSAIAILTIMSTSYDLIHNFVWKKKPSEANTWLRSFSVYTNTRRLVTVQPSTGALGCLDGIRVISMLWVIVGHTFVLTLASPVHNLKYSLQWIQQYSSVWLISGPITVDTFFLLSGVLCVYATIGKVDQATFIKNIPLFYLHRLLRMFPLFATMVLLQASLLNHIADGPYWVVMSYATQACRDNWWLALLYVQNYLTNSIDACLTQSWYLSVDMQLYVVCPIVLVWLFRSQRVAWTALTAAVIGSLISSTVISFQHNFPSSFLNFSRVGSLSDYSKKYYMSTLTRAPPFFVGMVYGYILHTWRDKNIKIHRISNFILWILSFVIMGLIVWSHTMVIQKDYDNQILDNILNSYMRTVWAIAVGWIIFACVHGYGGPINWLLSLRMWKVPARISYAMYLIHFSIMYVGNATSVKTHYFGPREALYRFMADLSITMLFAFLLCIIIDAPCSVLHKMIFQHGHNTKKTESLEALEENKNKNVTS